LTYIHTLLVILVAVMVLFAGCMGAGTAPASDDSDASSENESTNEAEGTDEAEATDDSAGETTSDDTTETTDGADTPDEPQGSDSSAESPSDDDEWRLYDFRSDEYYEYRIYSEEDGPGVFIWDVQSATDDRVTVETIVEFESGDRYSSTVTGTEDEVFGELLFTPAGTLIWSGLYSPHLWMYDDDIYVGYEWSYSSPEGSFRYAVTDTDSYAGQNCYVTVSEVDDQVVHQSCVSPDLAFPAQVAYYDEETGEPVFELELIEYRAG
jgi:hypothetical protein